MKKILLTYIYAFLLFMQIQAQSIESGKNTIKQLWDIANEEMAVDENILFLKAIPNLKDISVLALKNGDDSSWAFSNIYIAYCFMLNEESDSLGYYAKKVGGKIDKLSLDDDYAVIIKPSSSFLLGKYYYDKGRYEEAVAFYQRTIDALLSIVGHDENGVINYGLIDEAFIMNTQDLFNDTALVYSKLGDYLKSLEYYEIATKLSPKNKSMRILSNTGLVYLELGHLEKGISLIRQSEELLTDISDAYDKETLGLNYKNKAYYYYLKQNFDSCQIIINKALGMGVKDEFKVKIYQQYLKSLEYNFDSEKLEHVFDSLYLTTKKSVGYFHPDMARNYLIKGKVLGQQNKFEETENNFSLALNILLGEKKNKCQCQDVDIDDINDKRLALEIIRSKADNLFSLGLSQYSLSCYILLNKLLQELQQKYIINDESKYFLARQAKLMYEKAIEISLAINDLETAYEFSQSSRSMLLLQHIQDKDAIKATNIPITILQKGEQLKLKINGYQKKREQAIIKTDKDEARKWSESLFSYKKSYEKWMEEIEENYPVYYALKYEAFHNDLSDINKYLSSQGKVLVEYFLGKEKLYTFVLNGTNIKVDEQKIDEEFFERLKMNLEEVNHFNYSLESFENYYKTANYLYSKLLKKSIEKQWINKNDIVIVPDESLNLLSFEALISTPYQSDGKNINYGQLDYLLYDFNVSYAYSSHLLSGLEKTYDNPSFLGLAPVFEDSSILPLKHSQKEIEKINQLYNGRIFLREEGTFKAFSENIKKYTVVHLATHAIFNDQVPLDSRIELADSSLYIYEIAALSHDLQLAVMSACQTASGKKRQGEGIISLSRAFIESGCPSVVASLWDVADGKAGTILFDFHKNLLEGNQTKDVALANAKRKYLKETVNMNTHPFFWAGFVQLGDSSPLTSPTISLTYWIFLCIIPFSFFSIFFFLRYKR